MGAGLPDIAVASTGSELLRSQAIVAIEEGRMAAALEMLLNAIEDDPADLHARYYLGFVYLRMGDYPAAIEELEWVRSDGLKPENLEFELAVAYYSDGQVGKALELMEHYVALHPDERNGRFLLGMARYKNALYGPLVTPESRPREDKLAEARIAAAYARDNAPDDRTLGRVAGLQEMLDELAQTEKTWSASIAIGVSHDSNVGFFPDEGQLPTDIEDEADNRSMVALEGRWIPYRRQSEEFTAAYRFFQSGHQELDQYDARTHTVTLDYRASRNALVYGIDYRFHDYTLGGEHYRVTHALDPLLVVDHGGGHNSYLKLTYQDHSYQRDGDSGRDGTALSLLYRFYFMGGGRGEYRYVGLSLNDNDAEDPTYRNRGTGVNAGIQQRWQARIWKASIDYRLNDYYDAATSRDEGFLTATFGVEQPFTERLNGSLNLTAMQNDSTEAYYDFSRYLLDLMLTWEL